MPVPGTLTLKHESELETGIDIVMGTSQTIQPLRIFNAAGALLFGINSAGVIQGTAFLGVTQTITASGGISSAVSQVAADATAASMTLTLPSAAAAGTLGRSIRIFKKDATANTVGIVHGGSDTINGGTATWLLETRWAQVNLMSDGVSNWTMVPDIGAANTQLINVTATYAALPSDFIILGNTTAAAFTITLPAAAAVPLGKQYRIKKIDATVNGTLTVSRAGSDMIEGSTTVALATLYSSVNLVSDGVSIWYEM